MLLSVYANGLPFAASNCWRTTGKLLLWSSYRKCYLFKFLYCFVQLKTTTSRQLLCFWCSSVSTSVWLLRRRTSTTRSSHSWLGKPCHWPPDLTTCLPFHVVWSPLLMTTKLVHTHSVFFFMSANQVIFRVGVFKTSIQVVTHYKGHMLFDGDQWIIMYFPDFQISSFVLLLAPNPGYFSLSCMALCTIRAQLLFYIFQC